MDLIERYLQAVKFWLPAKQKDDIIAELAEDIRAQVEEQEAALGRPLNDNEVEALLKARCSPVQAANQYLPQESLIGPGLFPIYRLVLKILALCYFVPWLLVWVGLVCFSSSYRANQSFGALWGGFWVPAFITAGMVTLAFAILERTQAKTKLLDEWNPRKLPAVRDPNVIPRAGSAIEIALYVIIVSWFAGNLASPVIVNRPSFQLTLAPAWTYFFWGSMILTFASAALSAVSLLHPYWTLRRAVARLLIDVAGSGIFCWLLQANILASIVIATVPPDKAVEITNAINLWMGKSLPFGIIVGVIVAVCNAYRIRRISKTAGTPAHGMAAMTV